MQRWALGTSPVPVAKRKVAFLCSTMAMDDTPQSAMSMYTRYVWRVIVEYALCAHAVRRQSPNQPSETRRNAQNHCRLWPIGEDKQCNNSRSKSLSAKNVLWMFVRSLWCGWDPTSRPRSFFFLSFFRRCEWVSAGKWFAFRSRGSAQNGTADPFVNWNLVSRHLAAFAPFLFPTKRVRTGWFIRSDATHIFNSQFGNSHPSAGTSICEWAESR